MKNTKIFFLLFAIALTSCVQEKKQTKITSLPVTTQSKEALASFLQGVALSDQGDREKARELLTKAIEQDPNFAIAYVWRGGNTATTTQDFINDMAKAKETIGNASKLEQWYYQLYETFTTSDVNKRVEIAKMMTDSFPDVARTQVDLGGAYSNQNDEAKARACYQKAIDMDSTLVGAYTAMANSYLFLEPRDFKKAEEYAHKCVALAPSSPGALITLGDSYRGENDLARAKDAYSKAVSLDPTRPEAYYKEGHANTFLGNYDQARQNYLDGFKNDAIKDPLKNAYAYTYLYAGDPKTAQSILISYAMKADSSGNSKEKIDNDKLGYLGDCERICMHTGDAAGLKKLLAITDPLNVEQGDIPGTKEAKLTTQAGILYQQAMLSAMQSNFDDAKTKGEQIKTTLDPITDPFKLDQYHFLMGYIAMQQKNYTDAIQHFEDSHPENSVYTKYWLAKANEAAGNKDKAEAIYKDIAVFNFNGIDFALIRNEVVNRKPAV